MPALFESPGPFHFELRGDLLRLDDFAAQCEISRGPVTTARLPKSQRLNGHRRLIFAAGDPRRAARAKAAFDAVGVPCPAVAAATLDGEPCLVWSHVGGRFLSAHFDHDEWPLISLAGAPVPLRRATAADAAPFARLESSPQAVASLIDLPAAARYAAACAALGRAPRPRAYLTPRGAVLIPSAHTEPADPARLPWLEADPFMPTLIAAFQAASAALDAPALERQVVRWRGLDLPADSGDVRPFAGPPRTPLQARFRWAGAGPAKAVSVVLDGATHALDFDPRADLW